jgi:Sigma-70, region 4
VLRYYLQLSTLEVASALELEVGTVKSTLFRARVALARALGMTRTRRRTTVVLDERFRRAFEGAGEPADPSGVYEDLIRRRERRRLARGMTLGVVSVAVVAACIVGVVILSRVFAPTESRPGADGGVGPSVQPVPTAANIAPTGEDIGLGFPVCNVTSVAGVFAPGVDGTAWVATKAGDVGCPAVGDGMQVVAVDVSGDGEADASFGPLACDSSCTAFAAPDVDGDGTDELLVQNVEFSIVGLKLFEIQLGDGGAALGPVTVAPPGDPQSGLEPGAEPQLWLGGDAFDVETLRCEDSPEGLVLIHTTATEDPPDSTDAVWRATETTYSLNDDFTASIVQVREFTEPVGPGPPSFQSGETICGSNLGPSQA